MGFDCDGLSSFGDLPSFYALSANPDVLNRSTNDGADALQVRVEAALGPIIGVADPVPKPGTLATNGATICHDCSSSSIVSI
jgi:hypothetical protein